MIEGLFTGRKLADAFTSDVSDWSGARAIINGTDRAGAIAAQARQFHGVLLNADRPAPGFMDRLRQWLAPAWNKPSQNRETA